MTEQDAIRKFDFCQSVHYDEDVVEVYFDVSFEDKKPYPSNNSQVFYHGANITNLVDWDKIDKEINWKRVEEESNEMD